MQTSPLTSRRTRLAAELTAVALGATLGLSGCSSSDEPDATPSTAPTSTSGSPSSSSPASDAQVIEVTVKDGKVSPLGKSVSVEVGKTITLRVTSDADGELHVHSDPDHELEYGPGVTTLDFTIDRPSVVEVEDHTTDDLVVNLQAR